MVSYWNADAERCVGGTVAFQVFEDQAVLGRDKVQCGYWKAYQKWAGRWEGYEAIAGAITPKECRVPFLITIVQVILQNIMLRRRKQDTLNGKALIELPARTVEIVPCAFDAHEKFFYESLETKMEGVLEKLLAETKGGGGNYMSVLLLLLRLRQGMRLLPPLLHKELTGTLRSCSVQSSTPGFKGFQEG